jgi:amino-acid N-acetyltransferase
MPDHRNRGLGLRLVRRLELEAEASGLKCLVLLTQTAESFFARLGYSLIDRAAAPDSVKASAEFRSLCPASAVCMTKPLADDSNRARNERPAT